MKFMNDLLKLLRLMGVRCSYKECGDLDKFHKLLSTTKLLLNQTECFIFISNPPIYTNIIITTMEFICISISKRPKKFLDNFNPIWRHFLNRKNEELKFMQIYCCVKWNFLFQIKLFFERDFHGNFNLDGIFFFFGLF